MEAINWWCLLRAIGALVGTVVGFACAVCLGGWLGMLTENWLKERRSRVAVVLKKVGAAILWGLGGLMVLGLVVLLVAVFYDQLCK